MLSAAKRPRALALAALLALLAAAPAAASVQLLPANVDWVTSGSNVQFHLHFTNPDPTPTSAVTGSLMPAAFGAFLPNVPGVAASFDVPNMAPGGFADVTVQLPLSVLPINPTNIAPGSGPAGGPCSPDNHWDGNVDVTWSGAGGSGEVHRHVGHIEVCPGAGCSLIHLVTNCAVGPTVSIAGLCPGFHAHLVENDGVTPSPAVLPPNWSGYVCVDADAGTPIPVSCCFTVTFGCAGASAVVELCATTCDCQPTGAVPQPGTIGWGNVTGTGDVRFHVQFTNPSTSMATAPASGDLSSQMFGAFQPDYGAIGHFDLPAIPVGGMFDVYFDVPRSSLPADPVKLGGPYAPGAPRAGVRPAALDTTTGPCPPDTMWNGNVDLSWTAAGTPAHVNYHAGSLQVCAGSGASLVHVAPLGCPGAAPVPWAFSSPCPGFTVSLLNEDFSPAPNPVAPGWSGYIAVSALSSTPVPTTCCFTLTFTCNGVPGLIYLCATTCSCQGPPGPVPGPIDWSLLPDGVTERFHVRWSNPSAMTSAEIAGDMKSQAFGLFLPDAGDIGPFSVPSLAPNGFFDVFTDIPVAQLPPSATLTGGPAAGAPCPPIGTWRGNVDVTWSGPAGSGEVTKHAADFYVCPGDTGVRLHLVTNCTVAPAPWAFAGLCPGFSATLLNMDYTPAPNPVPPAWSGWIAVAATAVTPVPDTCCFTLTMTCNTAPAVVHLCAITCLCNGAAPDPALGPVGWANTPAGAVRFRLHWMNPDPAHPSAPLSGHLMSQPYGAFLQDFGTIGAFDVPSLAPGSSFDVFLDADPATLPPPPQKREVGGGPGPAAPCPQDTTWNGNVDVQWLSSNGTGHANYHVGTILVNTSGGYSFVHVISGCSATTGSAWTLSAPCPGFTVTLLDESFLPAPNPLPPGWTGWLRVSAMGVPPGAACCFDLTLQCAGASAVVRLCATACDWGAAGVGPEGSTAFAIRALVPNPSSGSVTVAFTLPHPAMAKLEVFDTSGQRVRTLVDGFRAAGRHDVTWDGLDARGRPVPSGAYFVRLGADGRTTSRKLVMRQ